MSSSDKRDMKSSVRNIDFHVGYIDKEIKKLVKILNKEGLRKSSRELELSFKKKILEFQKDVKNISVQHLEEDFSGITNVGAGYSNKEAQKFSQDAVNKAGKEIGKAQQRAVSIFTSDMKNKKYVVVSVVGAAAVVVVVVVAVAVVVIVVVEYYSY